MLKAWGEATGATAAGILMLSDAGGDFTRAIGMSFDNPAGGMFGRSKRYAMVVENGRVQSLHLEVARGVCEVTAGESQLEAL